MYYLVTGSLEERDALIQHLKANGVHAVFHYQSLHKSPYYRDKHDGRELPQADRYSDCLVRLPFFVELTDSDVRRIAEVVSNHYGA
jgi:dTDP-4-amino-4,6-dideoxygalactose transaminase